VWGSRCQQALFFVVALEALMSLWFRLQADQMLVTERRPLNQSMAQRPVQTWRSSFARPDGNACCLA
jgi:hypothetical protein